MSRKRFVTQTSIVFDSVLDEYRVKAYDQHGTRFRNADYFTNDKDDAETTAREMRLNGARLFEKHEKGRS